ncbi:MAG: hypothetical protein ACRDH2_02690 [Anaerolineales bacterium]
MVYKVSIVIPGSDHGGAIINLEAMPQVGDHLKVGDMEVEILEVMDLMPARGDFHFMHATCKVVEAGGK